MTNEEMWDSGETIKNLCIAVPAWIEQDISTYIVASILKGGCASGAYMPAVTYYTANQTMVEHGDDVLDYITNVYGELPPPKNTESWSGMAVFYLSIAVELWASYIQSELENFK